jgi:hypothetical protein
LISQFRPSRIGSVCLLSLLNASASSANELHSVVLFRPLVHPHPPSGFCAETSKFTAVVITCSSISSAVFRKSCASRHGW